MLQTRGSRWKQWRVDAAKFMRCLGIDAALQPIDGIARLETAGDEFAVDHYLWLAAKGMKGSDRVKNC